MAEFCKECFLKFIWHTPSDGTQIILSEEPDLCEGCGEIKPVVVAVKTEPFCPFTGAYCDVTDVKSCIGCEIVGAGKNE